MKNEQTLPILDIPFTKKFIPMLSIEDEFAISDGAQNMPMLENSMRTNDLAFYLCTSGVAELAIEQKTYRLCAGSFVVFFPGQILRDISTSDDFCAWLIVMSDHFIYDTQLGMLQKLPLILQMRNCQSITLDKQDLDVLADYLPLLHKKIQDTDNPKQRNIVLHLVQALFYECGDVFDRHLLTDMDSTKEGQLVSRFTQLVAQHCMAEHHINFYARKLSISPKYLSTMVKYVSGKTASDWINDFLTTKAKALLGNRKLTIQQISDHLHFTPTNFSKYFKEHAGVTPHEYRHAALPDVF
jgi:AraC-like DNA-binding protein